MVFVVLIFAGDDQGCKKGSRILETVLEETQTIETKIVPNMRLQSVQVDDSEDKNII